MDNGYQRIAEEAIKLAGSLPASLVRSLASAVVGPEVTDWPTMRAAAHRGVNHPGHRRLISSFMDCWQSSAADVSPQAVSMALITASCDDCDPQRTGTVELVWTGPDSGVIPLRRTEQVILQAANAAETRLLVASYAVYKVPHVGEALLQAAGRGVEVVLVLEAPDKAAHPDAYDTLTALGTAVMARCRTYVWPHEKRPADDRGRQGLFHVKCVAADAKWLLTSSANLTEYALTTNAELGLLVTGGPLPGRVERHFDRLIEMGTLQPA
jgi:cardiolipin synthase